MEDAKEQALREDSPENSGKSVLGSVVQKRFGSVLNAFEDGQLSLTWPDGKTTFHGQHSSQNSNNASVALRSYAPIRRLLTDGQIGFAESYIENEWSTDNLQNLFALIMRNEHRISPLTRGNVIARGYNRLQHWMRRNNKTGSERNIAYHYDLGNEFYKLWLDESMSYSSALYSSDDQSLSSAQQDKMHAVTEMLSAEAGSKVLEIGCGWGGLAKKIASDSACNVRGISLSKEQLAWANSRLNEQTSTVQASIAYDYEDYRNSQGRYDHIVSIEMFEAVGQQYWATYFAKLNELLESGGTAVLQIITLIESRFDNYCKKPDFIQRYIFPGGMLPSKRLLMEHIDNAGFELETSQWFGKSYARTLGQWLEKFEASSRDVLALDYDERFIKMWRYYLVYCQTGFNIGNTDVGLLKIRKR